jgi:hypothetical protein
VRFRLYPKDKAPANAMDGLTVRLWGDHTELTLPLDASHSSRCRATPPPRPTTPTSRSTGKK